MPRIDEWMPLFIDLYLGDTAHLDRATSGSYLHALMWEWKNGPLPNDMEQCARLMKIEGLGAPEIAFAVLKNFFTQDENACWIQKRLEKIRAAWELRAIRFSERGRKANAARWSGHVAKYPTRTPSSNANGNPIGNATRYPLGLPAVELKKKKAFGSLRSPGGRSAGDDTNLTPGVQQARGRKQGEAESPSDAPVRVRTTPSPPRTVEAAQIAGKVARNTSQNGASKPSKSSRVVDPRFVPFRREFLKYWQAQNPGGLKYGWTEIDGRMLNNLLRRYKSLDLRKYQALLKHRAQSDDINPAESPERWFGRLMEYAAGPLDRYRKPKRG